MAIQSAPQEGANPLRGESEEVLSPEEALKQKLLATASRRAKVTRGYFVTTEKSFESFAQTLAQPPYGISMDLNDPRSITLGIFALQKTLGFPMEDKKDGCDGMCGPLTYEKFKERLVHVDAHAEEGALMRNVETGDMSIPNWSRATGGPSA